MLTTTMQRKVSVCNSELSGLGEYQSMQEESGKRF